MLLWRRKKLLIAYKANKTHLNVKRWENTRGISDPSLKFHIAASIFPEQSRTAPRTLLTGIGAFGLLLLLLRLLFDDNSASA